MDTNGDLTTAVQMLLYHLSATYTVEQKGNKWIHQKGLLIATEHFPHEQR